MKNHHLISLIVLVILFGACAPTIYVAPDFDKVKSKHDIVAILPFDVQISMKSLPKDVTQEMIREDEKKTGFSMQGHSYTYFLKEQGKNKYSVKFQDIDKTNSLLTKAGLSYTDTKTTAKEELCKILGVDAVISGKLTMDKPMSDGSAIAVGLIFGYWGSTNKVNVSMTIHENAKGNLLWKYDWVAEGGVGSNSEQLSKSLVKNVSKKFPYQRK
ncbi:MAG: hypothetical protein IPM92_09205 [Saprospiraceae bacterium]|nr:hypothetical protein [Saprospiraceae bacterium]